MKTILIFLFAACSIFASCKKDKTQEDSLPPATQTGANTFGCYINGKLYVPKGFEQNNPNFDVIVDPTFQNGNFGISTFNTQLKIKVNFASNDIKSTGIFYINDISKPVLVDVLNDINSCYFHPSYSCIVSGICKVNGFLEITKYDLANSIFSGNLNLHFMIPTWVVIL